MAVISLHITNYKPKTMKLNKTHQSFPLALTVGSFLDAIDSNWRRNRARKLYCSKSAISGLNTIIEMSFKQMVATKDYYITFYPLEGN